VSLSFLAASLLLACQQTGGLEIAPSRTLDSVLVVEQFGAATGVAVVISADGLLLAHASALRPGASTLRTRDGQVFAAVRVAEDSVTQTVLLQTPAGVSLPPALPVATKVVPGAVVVAVSPAGTVRGQVAAVGRVGQMRPSLRYVPLTEVWLESSAAGSVPTVLVDASGSLVGLLGASLAEPEEATRAPAARSTGEAAAADFGPGKLEVAYAVGPQVLARVVEGFRSPSHKVAHPTVGILFRMSSGAGGVILESVQPGSTAEQAGLRAGDRVVSVDGVAVRRSTDLAAILFAAKPGGKLEVVYERDGKQATAEVRVAAQEAELTSLTIQRHDTVPL
jgi:S1-C subfamily serine protease